MAPKRKLSTSSDKIPSMTPIWFRYASSASASPGACRCVSQSHRSHKTLTVRCSKPNASMISFIEGTRTFPALFTFLPLLKSGRFGPSKTKRGRNGACMSFAQRKYSVRRCGFSPSLPPSMWKSQMLASIPRRYPRTPWGLFWNPSVTASSVRERFFAAGRRTCFVDKFDIFQVFVT